MKKKIAILGSTGSIGTQTLDIVNEHRDGFEIVGLTAGKNIDLLERQIRTHKPQIVAVETLELARALASKIADISPAVAVLHGLDGLNAIASLDEIDILVTAVVGTVGLIPTVHALKNGKRIALANKETLVAAGAIIMQMAEQYNAEIIPVDSEHSAIFQCLQGEAYKQIDTIHLTASGGSFRGRSREELVGVTVEQALKHPNWSMGAKITIDSATMMNKGLEVIEAHWLFGVPYDKINVIIHPESIVHSMVEFSDTSVIAQLGVPNMRIPIQYALTYPERVRNQQPRLSLTELAQLRFEQPDYDTFECLKIAYEVGKIGGTAPVVMNAANEVAVQLFLEKRIEFLQIVDIVKQALSKHSVNHNPSLEEIIEIDRLTRVQILNGGDI